MLLQILRMRVVNRFGDIWWYESRRRHGSFRIQSLRVGRGNARPYRLWCAAARTGGTRAITADAHARTRAGATPTTATHPHTFGRAGRRGGAAGSAGASGTRPGTRPWPAAARPTAVPRRADLRHQQSDQADADRCGPDLPRLAHAHARDESERQVAGLHLQPGHGGCARCGRAGRMFRSAGSNGRSEHGAFQHRRDRSAARGAREGADRQPAAHLLRPGDWRDVGTLAGRQSRRRHADSGQTTACHDITAYPAIGLAAGACGGNGILLDISDPAHPVRVDDMVDPSFSYWHSASFNNDGTKVLFTDEWGGGTAPRCRATDPLNWGANAIFSLVNKRLKFGSYYKMPAAQTEQENCVAHNGSLVPVPGRDIKVQAGIRVGRRSSTSPIPRVPSRSRTSIVGRLTRLA